MINKGHNGEYDELFCSSDVVVPVFWEGLAFCLGDDIVESVYGFCAG
jgi:hypothetical protein